MNTPEHATDAQIELLWSLLQLETVRNFEHAYRAQQLERDLAAQGEHVTLEGSESTVETVNVEGVQL